MRRVLAASQTYSFGEFELKSSPMALYQDREPVIARPQTLQLLELLVSRAGQVVSRQEIRERLWGDGRTVEFERSINTTMRDLRRALGDTYEKPSFIETVPRQGYRFVAPVQVVERPLALKRGGGSRRGRVVRWVAATLTAVLALSLGLLWVQHEREVPVTLRVTSATSGTPELSERGEELAADLYHVLAVHYSEEIRLVGGVTERGVGGPESLGRDYVLESNLSSLRPDELTIAVRLIDPSHESIVWSEVYRLEAGSARRWPTLAGRDVALALTDLDQF